MSYGFDERNIVLKTSSEIEIMREIGSLLKKVIARVVARAAPGVATRELDTLAYDLIIKAGAKPAFLGYKNYPATICASVNEQIVHGIPSERKLRDGDIVSIDIGLFKKGFFSDTAVTVSVGNLDKKAEQLLNVTQEALKLGIKHSREGLRLGDISSAIETFVKSHGFSVVREYTGHGIGRQLHEPPQIPNFGKKDTGPRLKQGMTFALEPMVNEGGYKTKTLDDRWTVVTEDGGRSAHFEHTLAITADGPVVLT